MEKDSYEEIKRLVEKKLKDEALKKLKEFGKLVKNKPSYAGYYWLAESYHTLDKEKYATKILENINLASEEIVKLPQKELPIPALLLKATAYYFLKQSELGIAVCDEIIKKKENGEAYLTRAVLKDQINKNDEGAWRDLHKAKDLGNKKAIYHINEINNRKK